MRDKINLSYGGDWWTGLRTKFTNY